MTRDKIIPFNPLHKRYLGESVGLAMLRRPAVLMSEITGFDGAGIYAIYYSGSFQSYGAIAEKNRDGRFLARTYIGKAVPKGTRNGADLEASPGRVLYNRIMRHKRNIDEALNLEIDDFHCRYLID